MPRGKDIPSVASATNLPPSAKGDQTSRMRKYLLSMGIRTTCFILAVILTGPARWVCVGLAVVLPYIAVVIANATNRRRIDALGSVAPGKQIPRLEEKHQTPL
ncbi:DUF3099 domain-containing protein [Allobranchiibius sp. GilTou38]|uniref:DUF3099 domain-containing protein n=1 Tax=Allobranchiibius sp. GilTou38 TaxID=2815210 RepID=UPI001AA0EBB2|nr:DUF3099 domain-containing protein [Allobranchiibius sp. GilTou38]MBO1766509.1 DUF3099 domain-containing protein [Allobranchiibius sp. GilTou38]